MSEKKIISDPSSGTGAMSGSYLSYNYSSEIRWIEVIYSTTQVLIYSTVHRC
jgi:hypothetical protein